MLQAQDISAIEKMLAPVSAATYREKESSVKHIFENALITGPTFNEAYRDICDAYGSHGVERRDDLQQKSLCVMELSAILLAIQLDAHLKDVPRYLSDLDYLRKGIPVTIVAEDRDTGIEI